MPKYLPRPQRAAFSMVELLVVVGIIVVLFGLLLPAVQKVRESVSRTRCAGNLQQIGLGFQMYRDNNDDRFPVAARVPSMVPGTPGIAEALSDYLENGTRVFQCPNDNYYFQAEGSSYEYPAEFQSNRTLQELTGGVFGRPRSSSEIWVLYDYSYFHGQPGSGHSRNFLYADGHVSN